VDNVDGIVVDHTVEQGNPADAPHLAAAVERITDRTGRPPRAEADRGCGEAGVEQDLHDMGVRPIWCGYGILAHNLTTITAAAAASASTQAPQSAQAPRLHQPATAELGSPSRSS
jgi:hypothetical protein